MKGQSLPISLKDKGIFRVWLLKVFLRVWLLRAFCVALDSFSLSQILLVMSTWGGGGAKEQLMSLLVWTGALMIS